MHHDMYMLAFFGPSERIISMYRTSYMTRKVPTEYLFDAAFSAYDKKLITSGFLECPISHCQSEMWQLCMYQKSDWTAKYFLTFCVHLVCLMDIIHSIQENIESMSELGIADAN